MLPSPSSQPDAPHALQADPLTLPQMPVYQSRQAPGAVGRSDVLAAITAAQCWEEVAAVVDNRQAGS